MLGHNCHSSSAAGRVLITDPLCIGGLRSQDSLSARHSIVVCIYLSTARCQIVRRDTHILTEQLEHLIINTMERFG